MREADHLSLREVPKEEAMHIIQIKRYQSPTGEMLIGTFENRVCLCDWTKGRRRESNDRRIQKTLNAIYQEEDTELAQQVIQQLNEYFAGSRQQFDLPLLLTGTTFQNRVWQALQAIPYGETCSYAELAQAIGNPKATRAVASANGSNPISILIPCHRVIGSDHKLVGYGGGIETKRFLLELERHNITIKDKPTVFQP